MTIEKKGDYRDYIKEPRDQHIAKLIKLSNLAIIEYTKKYNNSDKIKYIYCSYTWNSIEFVKKISAQKKQLKPNERIVYLLKNNTGEFDHFIALVISPIGYFYDNTYPLGAGDDSNKFTNFLIKNGINLIGITFPLCEIKNDYLANDSEQKMKKFAFLQASWDDNCWLFSLDNAKIISYLTDKKLKNAIVIIDKNNIIIEKYNSYQFYNIQKNSISARPIDKDGYCLFTDYIDFKKLKISIAREILKNSQSYLFNYYFCLFYDINILKKIDKYRNYLEFFEK